MRLFTLFLLLGLSSGLLLTACKKKTVAPKPHFVEVRFAGANLTSLQPYISAGSTQRGGPGVVNHYHQFPTDANFNGSTGLLQVPAGYDFTLNVSMMAIRPPQRVPAGASLKAELVIDGQVRKTLVMDSNTNSLDQYFCTDFVSLGYDEW
jgi:hypothetical protein